MKTRVLIFLALIMSISAAAFAAGDLTVDGNTTLNGNVSVNPPAGAPAGTPGNLTVIGNVTVNTVQYADPGASGNLNVAGYLTAINTIKAGVALTTGGNNWVTVAFNPPFTSVPVVTATAVRGATSNFIVIVKNVDENGFTFKAVNLDATFSSHTQTTDEIHWIAMMPTQ